MRIYSRLGDQGETSLFTRKGVPARLSKSDPRVEAYGTIDELNAWLGVVCAALGPQLQDARETLFFVQNRLFRAGYDISTMPQEGKVPTALQEDDTKRLEREIDKLQADLPPLQHFVLPGGCPVAAQLQYARTVARRAERRVVALAPELDVNPEVVRFINRLSDLLFVMARHVNQTLGGDEQPVDWLV